MGLVFLEEQNGLKTESVTYLLGWMFVLFSCFYLNICNTILDTTGIIWPNKQS